MSGNETPTAVLDACILYPAPLRDLFVELGRRELFRARWTDEIHDEWLRNLRARRPDLDPGRLDRTRRLMDEKVVDSLVTGHMPLIANLELPDPDDRHVLAAAIHCTANIIVTNNLRDFPAPVLARFGIKAEHPDDFLLGLIQGREEAIGDAVETICRRLANPPTTMEDYLNNLERQGLLRAVARLRELLDLS